MNEDSVSTLTYYPHSFTKIKLYFEILFLTLTNSKQADNIIKIRTGGSTGDFIS